MPCIKIASSFLFFPSPSGEGQGEVVEIQPFLEIDPNPKPFRNMPAKWLITQ